MDEFVGQLESVLSRVLGASDSKSIKDATEELQKVWYTRSETVPALVKILQTHPQPQMRQLSGVELRKLIPKFWSGSKNSLSPELMSQIKASLLGESLSEPNDLVRHTVARVISAIATIDLDNDRWPELLPSLFEAARSNDVAKREVSTYVLYALMDSTDYCAAACDKPSDMLTLLSLTVKDPESLQVRVNSVLALSGLSASLRPDDAPAFQQFIPVIVEVLSQCVACNDDKAAVRIFESLSDLIDSDSTLLGNAFGELLGHMISQYGSQNNVDPEYRTSAMRVVFSAVTYRYKRVQRQKLAPELTKELVQIIASECQLEEQEGDDEDSEDDADDITVLQLALQILETMAARLPPSHVITPLMQLLPDLVHTSNPSLLRAGYLAFSATADGAPEFVASEATTLLPWIVQGLMHDNSNVRISSLNALCQLVDGAHDKLAKEHATLVPLVYGIMDGARSLKVCRSACIALAAIMRTLSTDIVTNDYLPGLVPRFLSVVRDSDNLELKGFIVNTIGTTAEVAGRNYEPYFNSTVEVITPYVQIPAKDPNSGEIPLAAAKLVSESLGTLSRLCCAVGPEVFRPYLDPWMATVMACLAGDDAHLREMAPLYISEISEVYKDELAQYIPHLVPPLFSVLSQEEIYGDFENVDEDNLDDGIKVNTSLCIEKEFNLDCLGSLWKFVGPNQCMAPFFDESINQFKILSEHFYEDIRLSAVTALWSMMFGLKNTPQFEVAKEATWEVTRETLTSECDLAVLDSVFDIISSACKEFGTVTFTDQEAIEILLENIYEVLDKTHRVFEDFDALDDEADAVLAGEEDSEAASQLVKTSLELLCQLARTIGADFVPLFERFAEVIKPYAISKIDQERESGIGSLADLVGALGSSLSAYFPILLTLFGNGLNDSSEGVRSVSAYGIGLLTAADQGTPDLKAAYPTLIEGISKVVAGNDSRSIANGAGALARLALKYPDALPVSPDDIAKQLLSVLPLKDAYEEYPPILQFLANCSLNESSQPIVKGIWEQHLDAKRRDAIKAVSYLPADDPLDSELSMQGWMALAKMTNFNAN